MDSANFQQGKQEKFRPFLENAPHDTVGNLAQEVAAEIAAFKANSPAFREAFQQAKEETECYIDGTCVHIRTDEGESKWHEMRVGAYAKRECSDGAMPEEWERSGFYGLVRQDAFGAIIGGFFGNGA